MPVLGARDAARWSRGPEALLPRARTLIRRMAASLCCPRAPGRVAAALHAPDTAGTMALALCAGHGADGVRALNRALVLCADHELNASTFFAARVAASTEADLYACLAAALAALSGPRHGAMSERVEALLHETGRPERAVAVLRERTRRGEAIPGCGHALYPRGDPRAPPLLAMAQALAPRDSAVRTLLALAQAMRAEGHGTREWGR